METLKLQQLASIEREREKQMRSIKKNQKKATNIHGIYGTNVYIYRNQVNRKRQS